MHRSDFRHLERLRVRWAEVDMQHIVFNAHYLMYLDTAMAGYWRALALPYQATMAALAGDLYVKKAGLTYHGSARYDDLCEVGLRCARIGNSSLQFAGGVFRGEELLVEGELLYVFADPATQTSRPVPDALRQALQGFEAGEAMLQVQTAGWDVHQGAAAALRDAVFAREQGIDPGLMCDAADATAVHAIARNRLGLVVAGGRLLAPVDGVGKIGRMATLQPVRGSGAGRAVLDALLAAARARGDRAITLYAQSSAVGFYLRAGFSAEGPVFEEAGIPHRTMRLALA